jgi:hypothetical protein
MCTTSERKRRVSTSFFTAGGQAVFQIAAFVLSLYGLINADIRKRIACGYELA